MPSCNVYHIVGVGVGDTALWRSWTGDMMDLEGMIYSRTVERCAVD